MTPPTTVGGSTPVHVPGIVDGRLVTAYDPDGNVCLYLVFGAGTPGSEHHIEFVLSPDDAEALWRRLREGPRDDAAAVPCRVGLRLGHEYP
jgi:hypothetical protein